MTLSKDQQRMADGWRIHDRNREEVFDAEGNRSYRVVTTWRRKKRPVTRKAILELVDQYAEGRNSPAPNTKHCLAIRTQISALLARAGVPQ
jgi:hypothetical protein